MVDDDDTQNDSLTHTVSTTLLKTQNLDIALFPDLQTSETQLQELFIEFLVAILLGT